MAGAAFSTIVFDFDYTLADSSRGIIDCTRYALARLGLAPVGPDEVRATIGLPLRAAFLRMAGPAHERRTAEFLDLYDERARAVMVDQTALVDGVPEMIAALRDRGIRLAIASTKSRRYIEETLQRRELRLAFDAIIGGDDVAMPKPDPDGLRTAIDRSGGPAARALYVGDSAIDAETARRAAVPFVAVLSGVSQRRDFEGYEVFGIVERLSELPRLLWSPGGSDDSSSPLRRRQSSSTSRS
jgi:phosphoglycolate phosphatase